MKSEHPGLTVWFTGLSRSGKSTLSHAVCQRLLSTGHRVEVLDGDNIREYLSRDLGFSKQDRDENVRRIGYVAELLTKNGIITLVSAISPYRVARKAVRGRIPNFIEVYVNAPLAVCEGRDLKGLYRRARGGEIKSFTGVDDPYEAPENPEVECQTDLESVAESAEKVVAAICARLPPQHVNFILLGHARCGSNLLVRALAEHPQIRMAGEVLANDETVRAVSWERVYTSAWPTPRGDGYRIGEDGGEFLERRIFESGPVDYIKAFGFKLFYDHARFDEFSRTAWDYIASHPIKIIHLMRRNLFYALISFEVAVRTNQWCRLIEDRNASPPPLPPFELDPAACKRYFDEVTQWREWARQAFAKHDVLTIEYERDLCADFRATTHRVYEFLGATKRSPRPGMVKQQGRMASRQVTNFEEIRKFFQRTVYEEFFENPDSADGIVSARIRETESEIA